MRELILKTLITLLSLFLFGVSVWARDWTWIIIFGWLGALSTFMLIGDIVWGNEWKKRR